MARMMLFKLFVEIHHHVMLMVFEPRPKEYRNDNREKVLVKISVR